MEVEEIFVDRFVLADLFGVDGEHRLYVFKFGEAPADVMLDAVNTKEEPVEGISYVGVLLVLGFSLVFTESLKHLIVSDDSFVSWRYLVFLSFLFRAPVEHANGMYGVLILVNVVD